MKNKHTVDLKHFYTATNPFQLYFNIIEGTLGNLFEIKE
jgi:hypothetical protein